VYYTNDTAKRSEVPGSALPLTTEAASLIEKETSMSVEFMKYA